MRRLTPKSDTQVILNVGEYCTQKAGGPLSMQVLFNTIERPDPCLSDQLTLKAS